MNYDSNEEDDSSGVVVNAEMETDEAGGIKIVLFLGQEVCA